MTVRDTRQHFDVEGTKVILQLCDRIKKYFNITEITNLPRREIIADEFIIRFNNDRTQMNGHVQLPGDRSRYLFNEIEEIEDILIRIFLDHTYLQENYD